MQQIQKSGIKFIIPGDEYREQFKNMIKHMFDSKEAYDSYGYEYLDWHKQLDIWDNRNDFFVVVAVHRKKLVGFAILDLRDDLIAYIYNSWVLPKYRRRGIASFFKKRMLEEARAKGCLMILSSVDKGNLASRAMNKKAGWSSRPSRRFSQVMVYYKDLRDEVDRSE